MGAIGKGFDGAEDIVDSIMVHGVDPLIVLMIVQIEVHGVCFLDLCQQSYVE